MKAVFDKAKTIVDNDTGYICLNIPYRDARKFVSEMQNKKYEIEIKEFREKRSLDANAYFHKLVNDIAEKIGLGMDEVKMELVKEYGTVDRDDDGKMIGFKLPASVDVRRIYKYTKCFDTREENGVEFNCYIVYKRTRDLDSKEMARLIEGTVREAKDYGIETLTPAELARISMNWRKEQE